MEPFVLRIFVDDWMESNTFATDDGLVSQKSKRLT